MIELLYKKGYLDYRGIILDNYMNLDLTEKEAIVLISMLDVFRVKPNFKISHIVAKTNLKKADIQKILYRLSELDFFTTHFQFINKTEDEFYELKPFFLRIESLFDEKVKQRKLDSEQRNGIANLLSETLGRPLSSTEVLNVESWVEKGYTLESVYQVLKKPSASNLINFKTIKILLNDVKI